MIARRPVALFAAVLLGCLLGGCSAALAPPSRAAVRTGAAGRRRTGRWRRRSPDAGTVFARAIPGASSGFRARPAEVYLPAALARHSRLRLPVLELLIGTPGGPADWLAHGRLRPTLDTFAAHHHGLAPVVVVVDENGATHADTECVGAAEQYLVRDVPAYVDAHLPVLRDPRRWTVAGDSEGGMCAAMLALRHPNRFGAFADLSGLTRPTVGNTDAPAATIRRLFGGSRAAYERHDPLRLLARHRYPGLSAFFACGSADGGALPAQRRMVAAARRAGLPVVARTLPGGHGWRVWAAGLADALPWMWPRAWA